MKKWIIVTLLSAVFIVLEFLSPMDFQTGELQPDLLEPPTEILKSAVCNNGRIAVGYDSQENLLFYQTLDIEMTSPDILFRFVFLSDVSGRHSALRYTDLSSAGFCIPAVYPKSSVRKMTDSASMNSENPFRMEIFYGCRFYFL